jgi:two-component system sensor histidine kinase KdpD
MRHRADPGCNDVGEIVWAALDRCLPALGERAIDFDVPDDLPLACVDPGLLDEALVALFENVATHTPAGSPVWIQGRPAGSDVRLTISDAGPGIPPHDLERIFDKYERIDGRGQGLGLGLAIARAAVRAQGGDVWAESSSHGGARFVVLLPGVLDRGARA